MRDAGRWVWHPGLTDGVRAGHATVLKEYTEDDEIEPAIEIAGFTRPIRPERSSLARGQDKEDVE